MSTNLYSYSQFWQDRRERARQKALVAKINFHLSQGELLLADLSLSKIGNVVARDVPAYKNQQRQAFIERMGKACEKTFSTWSGSSHADKLKAVTLSLFLSLYAKNLDFPFQDAWSQLIFQINNNPSFAAIFFSVVSAQIIKAKIEFTRPNQSKQLVEAIHKQIATIAKAGPEQLFVDFTAVKLAEVAVKAGKENRQTYTNAVTALRATISPTKPTPSWTPRSITTANKEVQGKLATQVPGFIDKVQHTVQSSILARLQQLYNSCAAAISGLMPLSAKIQETRSRTGSINSTEQLELKPVVSAAAPYPAAILNKIDQTAAQLNCAPKPIPSSLARAAPTA